MNSFLLENSKVILVSGIPYYFNEKLDSTKIIYKTRINEYININNSKQI